MSLTAQLKTLLCFTMIVGTSFSADAAEICLKTTCRSQEQLVRLGDVADVRDADPARARELSNVELFPAPSRSRTLRLRELEELLSLSSVNLNECQFSGATTVVIHPRSDSTAKVSAATKANSAKAPRIRKETSPAPQVVVANRPLRKGEVLRAADMELRPATGGVQAAFFQTDELLGKETTRAIATGQMLEPDYVRSPVLVRKGEVIRVVAKAAGVRIKTNGRALEDGGHGDLIEVQPLEGKQRYRARVVNHQEAEVYAQGPSVE